MKFISNLRKFIKPIIVGILILLLSLSLTWFIDKVYEDKIFSLETLSSIFTIATSLVLFGIATSLYRKFDTNQSLLDKQTSEVLSLIEKLRGARISVEYSLDEEGPAYSHVATMGLFGEEVKKGIRKTILGKKKNKQFGSPSLFTYFESLIRIAGSLYMPKQISAKILSEFDMKSMFAIGISEKPAKYNDFKISVMQDIKTDLDYFEKTIEQDSTEGVKKYSATYNNKDIDVDDIVSSLNEIYVMAYKWVKQNNSEVLDGLNIVHPK